MTCSLFEISRFEGEGGEEVVGWELRACSFGRRTHSSIAAVGFRPLGGGFKLQWVVRMTLNAEQIVTDVKTGFRFCNR